MKLFKCPNCGALVYFENRRCEACGCTLGYVPERGEMVALTEAPGGWVLAGQASSVLRFCANAELDACNWLLPPGSEDRYCRCCRHNRTIPDLSQPGNLARWQKLEVAKHRLFYSLFRLGLPVTTRREDPKHGLAFDFLDECSEEGKVLTGHDEGLITLAVREADDARREQMRVEMGETYRTLVGHFRHEIGHYYWDRLIRDRGREQAYRDVFGDERRDYAEALKAHYENGPSPDWGQNFVSAYASSHPWEDFAETWAHYLHIIDAIETAGAFGLGLHPALGDHLGLDARFDFDPYAPGDFDRVIRHWLPLSFAVNALNRSMGHADFYPFILSPPVIEKLRFVHRLVHWQEREIAKAA